MGALSVNEPHIPGTKGFLDVSRIASELGLHEGMQVADFGCGSGYFTIELAKRVGSKGLVTALDIMEAPLESVQSRAKQENLANIETVRANLEVPGATRLADNSQDIVLLANILFQSQKKAEIVREARRVLKEGGRLAVIDWKKGAGGGPADELRTDADAMKELVAKEGFTLERAVDAGVYHFGLMFHK